MSRFINTDLKSDSESSDLDSEVESKSDAQLMTKLKSDFDQQLLLIPFLKKILKFSIPKKMTPKSQAKIKPQFLQIRF